MSDEILDALGDAFVGLNIGKFRKMTFLQWVELVKDDPQVFKYIRIKGDLIHVGNQVKN